MVKMIRRGLAIFLLTLVSFLLVTCNARLYNRVPERGITAEEMLAQLQFLRSELESGMGDKMQQLFPEGYFFSYMLYGLSWVNVGLQEPTTQAQALAEARWAYTHVDSHIGRAVFPQNLEPPYGMFYNGWRNYLLLGILLLQSTGERSADEWASFSRQTKTLSTAFSNSPTPFLASYTHQAWPVDALPALVSLRGYTHLSGDDRFEAVIERWLAQSLVLLDPEMSLIPHRTDYRNGAMLEGARATSQTLILRFLAELDPDLAQSHYEKFRQTYVVTRLGLPGVLEFPPHRPGRGDVDSGPLLFGVSLSATVVMMGTSRVFGDTKLASSLWQSVEFLGGAVTLNGERRYALGIMPIGDAFVVWSKSTLLWLGEMPAKNHQPFVSWWWRLPSHGLSLLILWLTFFVARKLWGLFPFLPNALPTNG